MCLCVCLRACQFAVNNSLSNMLCNQNKFPLTWTNKESYLILSNQKFFLNSLTVAIQSETKQDLSMNEGADPCPRTGKKKVISCSDRVLKI